jgi:hypothetical protein
MHDLLQLRAADSRTSMQALVTSMLCKELGLDLEETLTPKQAARRAALHAAVSSVAHSPRKGTAPNTKGRSPLMQALYDSGELEDDDEPAPPVPPLIETPEERQARLDRLKAEYNEE